MTAAALCAVLGAIGGAAAHRALGGSPIAAHGALWRLGAALWWCSYQLPDRHAVCAGATVGILAAACGAVVAGAIVLGAINACPCGCAP